MENRGKETWTEHVARIKREAPLDPEAQIRKRKTPQPRPLSADMAPDASGNVVRKHLGKPTATPIVGQYTLEGEGDIQYQAVDSKGVLKKLTPLEEVIRQSIEGRQEPAVLKAANRQLHAIRRSIARNAQKRSRGTEIPPEH